MDSELVLTLLKIFGAFAALSFVVFWVGLVWWVSQDVTSRTNDKIILAAAVAFATIFGPVGVLLYLIVRPRQTIKESYREMLETEINRKLASMDMAYCPFCGANLERDVATPHPDQLSMTDMDIAAEIAEPMVIEESIKVRRSETVVRGGKLLSVKISEGVVRAGKATAKGLTYLLTPLPSSASPTNDKRQEASVKRQASGASSEEVQTSVKNETQVVEELAKTTKAAKTGPTIIEHGLTNKPLTTSRKKPAAKTSRSGSKRGKK